MSRGHIPYGYQIENGVAVICEEKAERLRKIYEGYLGGMSLKSAAKDAGLDLEHSSVKCMLQNRHYLGDDFYPAIINKKIFEAFEVERKKREIALGRYGRKKTTVGEIPAPTSFWISEAVKTFSDPYLQAEYLYSLIESEG